VITVGLHVQMDEPRRPVRIGDLESGAARIRDLAAAGQPAARRVVDDAGRGLGRLIAAVAKLTVPQLVILGGEGVRRADVAADAVIEGNRRDRDPLASGVEFIVNHTDEPQWCRGAAVIAIQTYVLGAHDAPGTD